MKTILLKKKVNRSEWAVDGFGTLRDVPTIKNGQYRIEGGDVLDLMGNKMCSKGELNKGGYIEDCDGYDWRTVEQQDLDYPDADILVEWAMKEIEKTPHSAYEEIVVLHCIYQLLDDDKNEELYRFILDIVDTEIREDEKILDDYCGFLQTLTDWIY